MPLAPRLSSIFLALLIAVPSVAETPAVKPYMRVVDVDDQTIRLDLAFRIFAPADGKGPTIILGGAVHIADESFYELAQGYFDAQDLVLFEGVGAGHEKPDDSPAAKVLRTGDHLRGIAIMLERYKAGFKEYPASLPVLIKAVGEQSRVKRQRLERATIDAWGHPIVYTKTEAGFTLISRGADGKPGGDKLDADVDFARQEPLTKDEISNKGGIQGDLADALGLTFQLHAYDTGKRNYRNSDMTLAAIEERAKAGGGDAGSLVSMMDGSGLMAGIVKVGLAFIRASPRMQGTMKVMMTEMLTQMGEDMTKMKQIPPQMQALMKVLIEDRNQIVVNDLKKEIAKAAAGEAGAPQSIGVWYGAGHMKDLESRVVAQLGYKPVASFWLPAITTDITKAGMTKADLASTRAMLQRMLAPAK
jgi:hypothetical protein